MPAIQPLCIMIGINPKDLSKEENLILEAELFSRVCEEIKEEFRKHYAQYFRWLKFTTKEENIMLEANFLRLIIQDIIATEEYTLQGVACYTDAPIDVIQEIFDGRNTNPSTCVLRKTIDLHRTLRRELYFTIIKKIAMTYLTTA